MRNRLSIQPFLFRISILCLFALILQTRTPAQPATPAKPTSPARPATPDQPAAPADSARLALRHPVADLARTNLLTDLMDTGIWIYRPDTRNIPVEELPSLPYRKAARRSDRNVAPAAINRKTVLRFTITNSSDQPASAFFCPGFLPDSIRIYRLAAPAQTSVKAGAALPLTPLPRILPDDPDSLGYRRITLAPHDTATFIAVLTFIKAATNIIDPTLTDSSLIREAISINHKNKTIIDVITNLFAGIMLMMIFYAASEYLQTSKPEFLYYIGYSVCIGLLLFFKSTLHQVTTTFNYFFESFLDNILFSVGYIFYIYFHRKFLDTRRNFKGLDKFLHWGGIAITALMTAYIVSYYASPDFRIANTLEDSTKITLLLISTGFIIKGLTYRDRLMNYIVMGNISLCLLSIISQLLISTNFKLVKGASVLNLALFYYETGITIELLFFLFALTYKNKREIILSTQKEEKLKLETERKEMEKQVAVLAAQQDERNRISVDMHDELGSGVTAIRLMSEIVKTKMKDTTLPKETTLPEIEKISNSANELLNKMNTIIWTMTSSNDTVENLVAYIRSYAVEFFENTAIDCIFSMPAFIPPREISGEKRRNIFLSVKEALNNVLKHSQSSVVRINVTVHDRMIIEIRDDGIGIDLEKLRKFGNGLNNMKKRMASINGEFNIENCRAARTAESPAPDTGTRTTFYLTL
ncbi:MAG TPA: 7TM diverse intracellular signaling domain-containing protein [Puia sp.]|nr:7TM diverse intracellular signaling domain-containing protein [Puia sp.]